MDDLGLVLVDCDDGEAGEFVVFLVSECDEDLFVALFELREDAVPVGFEGVGEEGREFLEVCFALALYGFLVVV